MTSLVSKNTSDTKTEDIRSTSCPYLDTINRHVLDFDFEKLCSVSLSHINVYGCLVCGLYFQGRNKNSHAFIHSIENSHHVWINLDTLKFYCLPDNYEIVDAALNDIKRVLKPKFDTNSIINIDSVETICRSLDGTVFYPGIIGLNNIRETDYINVILHSLVFVKPIRDFFLIENNINFLNIPPGDLFFTLALRFGELVRKIWNPANFKSHVSPHEMVQTIVKVSKKRFCIEKQSDPIDFLTWFLNNLHLALNRDKNHKILVVNKTFQGKLKVFSRKIPLTDDPKEKKELLKKEEYSPTVNIQPFYFLSLDVPPQPLFTDIMDANIIPQVMLAELLCKFDGVSEKEYKTYKDFFIKKFLIVKLPKFLILNVKRFSQNLFYKEKNPTLVNFPLKGIDLVEYVDPEFRSESMSTVYNLIANIFVDQEPGSKDRTNFFAHLLHKPTGKWFLIRDLKATEVMTPMISLSESYIQIWEQQKIVN